MFSLKVAITYDSSLLHGAREPCLSAPYAMFRNGVMRVHVFHSGVFVNSVPAWRPPRVGLRGP